MFRRCLLAVAVLAFGLVAGCGPIFRSAWKLETALQKVEMAWMPNRLDYTVYQPSHRVALATSEVLKAELAEVKIRNVELTQDKHFDTPEGKTPVPGSVVIPDDYPACWLEGLPISKSPILVNCRLVSFAGKTKDGQRVDALVRLEIIGSDQRTVVSVQVGGHGDAKGSKNLIDKISERIQNPSTRPGSPEERAALKAAFDVGPKGDIDFSAATGEITIRMD
jgi:hypothetical protein